MAAKTNELLDAYDWIRAHTTIDVARRRIEIRDIDEVDYSEMQGDPFEVVRRAHAVKRKAVIKTAAQLDAETRAMGFFAPGGKR